MLSRKTRLRIRLVAILTAFIGVVNVLSSVTPSLPERIKWLEEIFPWEVRASGHIFATLSGFFLLILSINLLRRKRLAWLLTIILLIISIISHLVKGFDYEESTLAFILLIQLILMRDFFTARSDRPSIAQGIRILIAALLFTLAYGSVGFFLLDKHYNTQFDLPSAIAQTLAMFFTDDNAGLKPTTRFGVFFVDSIYLVGIVTLTTSIGMLFRPVLLRGSPANIQEKQQAQNIVEQYGQSSLARFTLLDDKAYYFSPSGQSYIAYVPKGRGAIALGDPIGPLADRTNVIQGFQQFCQLNDWYPAFYQTSPNELQLYQSLGFQALKIGEEAIVDLHQFSLKGKSNQNLRTAINRMTKLGYTVKFYQPPISEKLLSQLKEVSDEWLNLVHGAEKKFSVGWFDVNYLKNCEIVTVENENGQITAFANIVTEYQLNEITIDLMRRRTEIENGTMDFLFISLFEHYQKRNYKGFNLGLSALSGVGETAGSPRLEKALNYLYQHLNQFYNFKGLHTFKEKFRPQWEPRYLIYPSVATLADIVVALVRADSGDRLLDYLKPGS